MSKTVILEKKMGGLSFKNAFDAMTESFRISALDEIADTVHTNAVAHGFHPLDESEDEFIWKQCNNIHDEVSELHQAWRCGALRMQCDKPIPLNCAEEELADIIIRALDVSRRLKLDIVRAIAVKHAYNITRPHKHGKRS